MVGRHHHDDGVGRFTHCHQGRDRNGRSCTASDRLEHDCLRFHAAAGHLLPYQKAMIVVAEQYRGRKAFSGGKPRQRVAKKAFLAIAEEVDELLGVHGARDRPEFVSPNRPTG